MSIRLFISSVSIEFDTERKALEKKILQLGELYVGMEYFGSDPRSAVSYDSTAVEGADLYVGLFGEHFGSIATESGKSFTQLEFETARARNIPTLVYFKNAFITGTEEPGQIVFKKQVRAQQLGAVFTDVHDLADNFLIDLFNQIRGPLFAKMRTQLGAIPFDLLHAITRETLPQQVKIVGQEKYIQNVYVRRPAEDTVQTFIGFEQAFSDRAKDILEALKSIASTRLAHDSAELGLQALRAAVDRSHDRLGLEHAVKLIKTAYHFDDVEEDFTNLINIDRESNPLKKFRALEKCVGLLRSRSYLERRDLERLEEMITVQVRGRIAGGVDSLVQRPDIRRCFPAIDQGKEPVLANDLIKELVQLIEASSKRCLALVDRAGRGKTNLVCRIAESLIEKNAVVLLSGRMELSNEYQLEWHVRRQIETALGGGFTDWMGSLSADLEKERRWFYIIVDGINESTNPPLLTSLLRDFLPKLEGRRIKVIVSCRDIYWELFLPAIKSYLFREAVGLGDFSEEDWKRATELYFHQFKITADLRDQAAVSLRSPLLLRFFCEAHRGQQLGSVSDVHLRSVFKLYIERVTRNIAERKALVEPYSVQDLLLRVVDAMWQSRLPAVEQSDIGLSPEELSSSESIYNLVRSENVILSEARGVSTTSKSVRFVYDEFMEYLLARYWFEKSIKNPTNDPAIDVLLRQAMEASVAFPTALGAVFFLDEMLSRKGQLINRALSSSRPVWQVLLDSRQAALLTALEHMDKEHVNDDLLTLVRDFEVSAADELRPRLSAILIELLENNPNEPGFHPVVARMLEVGPESSSTEETDKDLVCLPPARYHYSEETKLNAIALVIDSRTAKGYELAERGIRRLGRMDLHAALSALKSVDMAGDDVVYKTIEKQMNSPLPEYQIYCAWLLRRRYGREPARLLLKLLSANETRVHKYAFSLFEERHIEKEFLDGVLGEYKASVEVKPWLLIYRIKLLANRMAFLPPDIVHSLGESVVDLLKSASKHPKANVRLAAFRALTAYPEYVDRTTIAVGMQGDADQHIRAFAARVMT